MTWHRLVFDPSQQAGAGEYTFRYKIQTHGVVMVKFSRGKISNWREYEIESNAPWEQFVGRTDFRYAQLASSNEKARPETVPYVIQKL